MKKLSILLLLLVLATGSSQLFAQTISPENSSEFYYFNISLERVYPTRLGYLLQYRAGPYGVATLAIPNGWFTFAGARAELINLPPGNSWPYMSVFYRNGEFSHIRIYVHRSRAHQTWGNVPLSTDLSIFFDDVDENVVLVF